MYTVIQTAVVMVIGIACRTSNDPSAAPQDIPKHWQRFYTEGVVERIPNKASADVIALYCDYEGDYTKPYTLVIGCPVTSIEHIPEGMVAKVIPAGSYARFAVSGEFPASVIKTWNTIWNTNLARTYTGDYELYRQGSPQALDVFVAVNSA